MNLYNDYRKFATSNRVNGSYLTGTLVDDYHKLNGIVTNGWQSPTIIENSPNFGVAIDIYSRLLQDRIIFIGTEIDETVGNVVTSQLLYLNSVEPEKPITIHLNTPGGSVTDGLSIYDSMMYVSTPIYTICTGLAASMGSVLLAAGEYGHRFCQKHSRVMIHEVSAGQRGKMSDMADSFRETKRLNDELFKILALHTGHSVEHINEVALRRDYWMSSEEALKFGVIDRILEPKKEIKAPVHEDERPTIEETSSAKKATKRKSKKD